MKLGDYFLLVDENGRPAKNKINKRMEAVCIWCGKELVRYDVHKERRARTYVCGVIDRKKSPCEKAWLSYRAIYRSTQEASEKIGRKKLAIPVLPEKVAVKRGERFY